VSVARDEGQCRRTPTRGATSDSESDGGEENAAGARRRAAARVHRAPVCGRARMRCVHGAVSNEMQPPHVTRDALSPACAREFDAHGARRAKSRCALGGVVVENHGTPVFIEVFQHHEDWGIQPENASRRKMNSKFRSHRTFGANARATSPRGARFCGPRHLALPFAPIWASPPNAKGCASCRESSGVRRFRLPCSQDRAAAGRDAARASLPATASSSPAVIHACG